MHPFKAYTWRKSGTVIQGIIKTIPNAPIQGIHMGGGIIEGTHPR